MKGKFELHSTNIQLLDTLKLKDPTTVLTRFGGLVNGEVEEFDWTIPEGGYNIFFVIGQWNKEDPRIFVSWWGAGAEDGDGEELENPGPLVGHPNLFDVTKSAKERYGKAMEESAEQVAESMLALELSVPNPRSDPHALLQQLRGHSQPTTSETETED